MMKETVSYPKKDIPVRAGADVVVVGGGPSGFAAAVCAARKGLSVVLIERYGFLGGMATAGAVGTVCGLYLYHPERIQHIIEGFAKEVTDALVTAGGAFGPFIREGFTALLYNPWHVKRLLDRMVKGDERITLMLHSRVADVVIEGGAMTAVIVASPEGLFAVRGKVFVDATGDAVVALACGAETVKGDENGKVMTPTMMFFCQGMDIVAYQQEGMAVLNERIQKALDEGTYPLTVGQGLVIPTFRPGEAMVKMSSLTCEGRALDGSVVADITLAELSGREGAEAAMEFLKNEVPGFAGAFLSDTAVQVGIRETRRIVGEYVLSRDDVLSGRQFDDAVCLSSWPLELWDEGALEPRLVFLDEGSYYGIPYRCMLPKGVSNLLVTGRAISTDHDALASSRVMGPCMAEGQAAAAAAGCAIRKKSSLIDVDTQELRSELIADGARLE
ncbi:MAG: FAD-dependent oxidoreductase [Deltaproteobacteria bacterium]|nr:FAD-dependent oxidoreductase [Candidatus Zymogenaceae bacterium]